MSNWCYIQYSIHDSSMLNQSISQTFRLVLFLQILGLNNSSADPFSTQTDKHKQKNKKIEKNYNKNDWIYLKKIQT